MINGGAEEIVVLSLSLGRSECQEDGPVEVLDRFKVVDQKSVGYVPTKLVGMYQIVDMCEVVFAFSGVAES